MRHALCLALTLLQLPGASADRPPVRPRLAVYYFNEKLPVRAAQFADGRWYVPLAPLARALSCAVTEDRAQNRILLQRTWTTPPQNALVPPPAPPSPEHPALYVEGQYVGQADATPGSPVSVPVVEVASALQLGAYASVTAGKLMISSLSDGITVAPGDYLWESYAQWCAVRNGRGRLSYYRPTILSRAYANEFNVEIRVERGFLPPTAKPQRLAFRITAFDRQGFVLLRDTACLPAVSPAGGDYILRGPTTRARVGDIVTCEIEFIEAKSAGARGERAPDRGRRRP